MLTFKESNIVKDFITQNDIFRLTDVCNFLVENGSDKSTYSTGKLRIYPMVGAYIKSVIPKDKLEIKHIENDVLYTKVSNLSFEVESEVEMQVEKDKRNLGQLSLF